MSSSRTVLQQTHSTVCGRRTSRREQHTVSGRRHQQIGHRERQADHSRYSSGSPGSHPERSPHPRRRSVVTCLVVTGALCLLYLALIELFGRDAHPGLIWFGLLVILFGGAVIENAIRLDGMTDQEAPPARRSTFEDASFTPGLPA